MAKSKNFVFDGGAGTYLGTQILGLIIIVFTLGIAYPYALVLQQRWIAKHTYIKGFRLKFNGLAIDLFAQWVKWLFLMVITLGIYGLWVAPRLRRWIVEHTDFDEKQAASLQPESATAKP